MDSDSDTSRPSPPVAPAGLFRRIFLTFVLTVLAAATVGAFGTFWMTRQLGDAWVGRAIELLGAQNDELYALLEQPEHLQARLDEIEAELRTQVGVYELDGRKIAGHGPPHAPRQARRFHRRLRQGHPVVRRPSGLGRRPVVLHPIDHPDHGTPEALVFVRPHQPHLGIPFVVSAGLIFVLLAAGAWVLSRSFTRRLATLERSAGRIAQGELGHRVELRNAGPHDEIDDLGVAFNEMAGRVQTLVRGQQTLLANVSHELRTPISRVRVLVELLQDRANKLEGVLDEPGRAHLTRLQHGLADMETDTVEIERLIRDLLTSGRLELRAGGDAGLQKHNVDVAALVRSEAQRVDARVDAPDTVLLWADELLLERLLSNLLANARRACPEDEVHIEVHEDDEHVTIAVQDRGPGIPEPERERVFEAFRRLDEARSRDRGGVGLGLYLCRQIARAHGGDIVARDRPDGACGARMELTLPKDEPPA